MMRRESLPDGLDFPSFPSLELSRLITPIIYSQNSYLVYIFQISLIQSTPYQLYKLQPFPMEQQDSVFVYVEITKEFLFTDAMRHTYGKLSYPELQACFMPNDLNYVCKENLTIVTYVPNADCESTLIHPSTTFLRYKICEQRMLTLDQTYWIPLYFSNKWLFTAPARGLFTILCEQRNFS